MVEVSEHNVNRVLIALDALQENHSTLETAIALAARQQAELMTLFIEDLNLVHLASLPFASEIDRTSAVERKLDSIKMTRTFRTQTQKLSRLLDQLTSKQRITYSLKVVRGNFVQEALSATGMMDVLFLSRRIGKYGKKPRVRRLIREDSGPEHKVIRNAVWVIYEEVSSTKRVLSMACDLALSTNRDVVLLIQAAGDQIAQRIQQSLNIPRREEVSIHYFNIPSKLEDDELIQLLHRKECGILVLPGDELPDVDQRANIFLQELECPVVLVR